MTSREAFEAAFEAWWQQDGQYCRAGGGDYEKTFAYAAYEAGRTAERAECERLCARSWGIGGTLVAKEFAEAIRARGKP